MADIALTTPSQIGATIRSARTRADLTQSELAERAGVSRRWLISVEQGQAERAELGKILDTLDTLGLELTVSRAQNHGDPLAGLLENL